MKTTKEQRDKIRVAIARDALSCSNALRQSGIKDNPPNILCALLHDADAAERSPSSMPHGEFLIEAAHDRLTRFVRDVCALGNAESIDSLDNVFNRLQRLGVSLDGLRSALEDYDTTVEAVGSYNKDKED